MSLRNVALMSADQKAERREMEQAAFFAVQAYEDAGETRTDAFTKAAKAFGVERGEMIAAYWQHVRRTAPDANAPTRTTKRRRRK